MLIGSPQAGSTWLYSNLILHPDIDIPWKEMAFWSRYPGAPTWLYERAFDPVMLVRGDMTPHYGILRPDVIRRVRATTGDARLILIVRDPAERAWSAVRRRFGRKRPLDLQAVTAYLADPTDGYPGLDPTGDFGAYSSIVDRWVREFGRQALLVLRYADMATGPDRLVSQVLSHIGADRDRFPWDRLVTSAVNANPVASMPADVRVFLEERYQEEANRLNSLLGPADWW